MARSATKVAPVPRSIVYRSSSGSLFMTTIGRFRLVAQPPSKKGPVRATSARRTIASQLSSAARSPCAVDRSVVFLAHVAKGVNGMAADVLNSAVHGPNPTSAARGWQTRQQCRSGAYLERTTQSAQSLPRDLRRVPYRGFAVSSRTRQSVSMPQALPHRVRHLRSTRIASTAVNTSPEPMGKTSGVTKAGTPVGPSFRPKIKGPWAPAFTTIPAAPVAPREIPRRVEDLTRGEIEVISRCWQRSPVRLR